MTNVAYEAAFTQLKANLVDNLAVHHERVTLLVQLMVFDIQATRVNFEAKIVKPLHQSHAEKHPMYKYMRTKEVIKFGWSYQVWPR